MEQELPDLNIYISFHEDDGRLVKTCVKVLERTIKGGLTAPNFSKPMMLR